MLIVDKEEQFNTKPSQGNITLAQLNESVLKSISCSFELLDVIRHE